MSSNSNSNLNRPRLSKEEIQRKVKRAEARFENAPLPPGSYAQYIDYLRTKPTSGPTEKHHIVPRHKGGSNDPSNLIEIETRDHILAHLILFLEEGGRENLIAYTFRISTGHVDLKTQGQKIAFLNKIQGKGLFNPQVQSALGQRGGKIGGAVKSPAQQQARSIVGQTYGRTTGLGNQSQILQEVLAQTMSFSHDHLPNRTFVIGSQQSAIDAAKALNEECDRLNKPELKLDLAKVKKGGSFYDILKNKKKSAQGWQFLGSIPIDDLMD